MKFLSSSISIIFFSTLLLITLLLASNINSTTSLAFASSLKCNTTNTLIQNECNATHFPALCCKEISQFASTVETNPQELCKAGVIASINSTQSVVALLERVSLVDEDEISWCKSAFNRSVGEIKEALNQYNANVNETDVGIFKDAVVTYTIGALSDEEFCLIQLGKSGVKAEQKDVYAAILRAVKLKRITKTFVNRL